MGENPQEIRAHIEVKRILRSGELTKCIGAFVRAGAALSHTGAADISEIYVPWVTKKLEGAIPDCILPYSIALWFSKFVSILLCEYVFSKHLFDKNKAYLLL